MFPRCATEVSQRQIDEYAQLSSDFNPLHVDPEFAAQTEFGSTIAHGSIPMNSILRSLSLLVDDPAATGVRVELKLVAPARPGDLIVSEGEPADGHSWSVRALNERGEPVIVGTAFIQEEIAHGLRSD